ncbi:MAG: TMEM165/GDT1 family protein [Thermoproteota archaeon]
MDLTPLIASFLLVAVAELGDKTQLTVITLSSCSNAILVFTGAMLGFMLVAGIGVVAGNFLTMVIPIPVIRVASALLFLAYGVYTLLSRKSEEPVEKTNTRCAALSAFSMITLMELGDKTQLAVIALAAEYSIPILVYAGVIAAFTLVTGLGVLIGRTIMRLIPLKYVKLGSGIVFLLFGILFLINIV